MNGEYAIPRTKTCEGWMFVEPTVEFIGMDGFPFSPAAAD